MATPFKTHTVTHTHESNTPQLHSKHTTKRNNSMAIPCETRSVDRTQQKTQHQRNKNATPTQQKRNKHATKTQQTHNNNATKTQQPHNNNATQTQQNTQHVWIIDNTRLKRFRLQPSARTYSCKSVRAQARDTDMLLCCYCCSLFCVAIVLRTHTGDGQYYAPLSRRYVYNLTYRLYTKTRVL